MYHVCMIFDTSHRHIYFFISVYILCMPTFPFGGVLSLCFFFAPVTMICMHLIRACKARTNANKCIYGSLLCIFKAYLRFSLLELASATALLGAL